MMQTERIKKMLHILKTNENDLDTYASIIDYDLEQTCDSEKLTLYLKESYNALPILEKLVRQMIEDFNNSPNNEIDVESYVSDFTYILEGKDGQKSPYIIYKNFYIYSQLYYDASEDKYFSALDGDIVVEHGALPKITILTNLSKLSLSDNYTDIQVEMIDADTLQPIKNQSLSLYLGSFVEPIAYATTNKDGIATFHFSFADMDEHLASQVTTGKENYLYIQYDGNKKYRKWKTSPILVQINGLSDEAQADIQSNVTATIDTSSNLTINYNISLDNKTLTQGFRDISADLSQLITDDDLLKGDVLFYVNDRLVGQLDTLTNSSTYSYASITTPLLQSDFNKPINVGVIFQGNQYFTINTASIIKEFSKIKSYGKTLQITQPDLNQSTYNVELSFKVPVSCVSDDMLTDPNHVTTHLSHGGQAKFYLYDSTGVLDTTQDPFATIDSFTVTKITDANEEDVRNYYLVSATKTISVDLDDYNLTSDDAICMRIEYDGSTLVEDFAIEETLYYHVHLIIKKNISTTSVANATVQMDGKICTTDSDGNCYFTDVSPGYQDITISKEGYRERTVTIYVYESVNSYEISLYTNKGNSGG